MFAYGFYGFDKTEEAHFIGILKEKRENLLRIARESVLNLKRRWSAGPETFFRSLGYLE